MNLILTITQPLLFLGCVIKSTDMKTKMYFKNKDSELCYSKGYFDFEMKENNLKEIEVYEAVSEKIGGIFWCNKQGFCGDGSENTCGKQCIDYKPRNGKSGCCKHYTTQLYTQGNKVTLQL